MDNICDYGSEDAGSNPVGVKILKCLIKLIVRMNPFINIFFTSILTIYFTININMSMYDVHLKHDTSYS